MMKLLRRYVGIDPDSAPCPSRHGSEIRCKELSAHQDHQDGQVFTRNA